MISKVEKGTTSEDFEILTFDLLETPNKHSRFCCVYISPDNSKNIEIVTKLLAVLRPLVNKNNDITIIGDFNFSSINWKDPKYTVFERCSDKFLSFINTSNLSQLIDQATHIHGNTLDLVLASNPLSIESLTVREPLCDTNDHNMIEMDIKITQTFKKSEPIQLNFFKADYDGINSYLRNIDWATVFTDDTNIDCVYQKLINILENAIQKYVPIRKKRSRPKMPKHIKSILNQKKKMYQALKSKQCSKEDYKKVEKAYKIAVRQLNNKHEKDIVKSKNKNYLYKYLNKKLKHKNVIPPLKSKDGTLHTDSLSKANLLNQTFKDVFIVEDEKELPTINQTKFISEMPFNEISIDDVKWAIKNLKNSVSRTPDQIPSIFLKRTINTISLPLMYLFNISLAKGKIPTIWKEAIIIPIFKKGLKNDPNNFRPISLTSSICRTLEKIIQKRLMKHLLVNNLISNNQYGFIPKRSTLSQHINFLDELTKNLDNKLRSDVLYLDFSKAFDRVSHSKLLLLLAHYKIHPQLINWIRDHLSNRLQRTVVENKFSNYCSITSGVPQGSVLSPTYFIIYVNELLQSLTIHHPFIKSFGFADDIKLLGTDQDELQRALNLVDRWTQDWDLKIQTKKSDVITFDWKSSSNKDLPNYNINQNDFNRTKIVKDLGIYISNNLKWKSYITKITNKTKFLSYLILKTFKTPQPDLYISLYKTYIRPIMEFNTSAWSPTSTTDIKVVETVQKSFTRKVLRKLNIQYSSYQDRLKQLKLRSLEYRRLQFDLILVYKILNNLIESHNNPPAFILSNLNTTYNLRRHSLYIEKPQKARTQTRQNFFLYRIINVWNNLPDSLVTSPNLQTFKQKLKQFDLSTIHNFIF